MQLPVQTGATVNPSGPNAAYQRIDSSTDSFGGQVATAGMRLGDSLDRASANVNDVALKYQAIQNEGDRVNAENKLLQASLDLQNGTDDQPGFRTLQGRAAIDSYDDYQGQLQTKYQEIRGTLNPAAQRMFDATGFKILRSASDSMGQHKAQQQVAYAHIENRKGVALAQDQALNTADDPAQWDAAIGTVQVRSLDGSRVLGLGPDATEAQRRADVSEVYEKRTQDLLEQDPIAAQKFYQQNIRAIDPLKRHSLEVALKSTVDTQYAHTDGTQAFLNVTTPKDVGAPPLPGAAAVPDHGADFVKPYDAKRIDDLVNLVKKPSPYDDLFKAAAAKYNVNPVELKMRAAAESGLRPDPKENPKAIGIMQFTPDTAKRYGIDPKDAAQAIDAAARIISEAGGTVGANTESADRAYYGGNATAKGPNTDQYVDNLKAVRARLFGGGSPAPMTIAQLEGAEGGVVDQAKQIAEQRRPGDAVYSDKVVSEARKAWALKVQTLKGEEYQKYSGILQLSVGDQPTLSQSDLPPDKQADFASLTPQNQKSLEAVWRSNTRADDKQNKPVLETPDNRRKYLELAGQAVNDPVAFKSRDIAADIDGMPSHLANSLMQMYVGIDKQAAKGANYQRVLGMLSKQMEVAKIHMPSPNYKGNLDDYNAFTGMLAPIVDNFVDTNKRQPTPKEVNELSAPLFAQMTIKGGGMLGLRDKTVPAYKLTPDQESHVVSQINPADKGEIAGAFASRYGRQPDDNEVQQWYLNARLHPGDAQAKAAYDAAVKSNSARLQKQADAFTAKTRQAGG